MEFFAADLEQQVTHLGSQTVLWSSLILAVTTVLAVLLKDRVPKLKLPLFLVMAVTLVGSTLTLMGGTVYLNTKAESGGPVHWHTDVEFWACGTELELRDPSGFLSNKIGTATYHEHNDKRIHLEGVVVRKAEDASLEKFMRVTGGYLNDESLGLPLNEAETEWFATGEKTDGDHQGVEHIDQLRSYVVNGDDGPVIQLSNRHGRCGDAPAEVQAFVYRYNTDNDTYSQSKLNSPVDYLMRDESQVPPGDCLIVEYDQPKDRTDKLCEQYGVRDSERCIEFGVEAYSREVCNISEVTAAGGND